MAAYTGPGNFPYSLNVGFDGLTASGGVLSENVPAVAGQNYSATVTAAFVNTWASGAIITLTWYTAGDVVISSATGTQTAMTGGTQFQWSTGLLTAPANTSYFTVQVSAVGTPLASNTLQLFQASAQDQNNNQININYAFTYTYWPWSAVNNATLSWASTQALSGDSDSLVLDGIIELMGGIQGVQSDVPELLDSNGQGPTFRVLAPPSLNSQALGYQSSYDLNSPQPTQDVVASMLLDGERPFGQRASNRTISLPIIIFGTMAGGMAQVLAAREYLAALIDQQTWQIKWTSADTGLCMILDCFRALPSTPVYGFNYSAGGSATGSTIGRANYPIALINIQVQALPYGRSDIDGVQNISLASPLTGQPSPPGKTLLDNYSVVGNVRQIGSGVTGGATTVTIPLTASAAQIASASGIAVAVAAGNATAQTVSVTDSQGNAYTLTQTKQNATAPANSLWVFTSVAVKHKLTGNAGGTADFITVTTTNSQAMCAMAYGITGGFQLDTSANSSGSSTAPAVTNPKPAHNDTYTMVFYVNNNAQSAGTPATINPQEPWQKATGATQGNIHLDSYWTTNTGQNSVAATSSYGVSSSWSAISVALDVTPGTSWVQDNQRALSSSQSAYYYPPKPIKKPYPAAIYAHQLAHTVNIQGLTVMSVYFGQSYDVQWPKDPKFVSNVRLAYTLWDSSGNTLSFSVTKKKCKYGGHPVAPKWTLINAAIPQGKTNFNYSAVAAYRVTITNWHGSGHTGYVRMHAWLNGLTVNPPTVQNPVSPRGYLYNLFSLPGTARSPVSLQAQLPAAANITRELTSPASGTFIVPAGVFALQAEAWGGGGAGSSLNLNRSITGGGGGGGEYAQEPVLAVTPGQKIPYSIGAGGTPAQLASTVIQYTDTGTAHWTCPANVNSVLVEAWGGGAAGSPGGGGGGGGSYQSGFVPVTPGNTYNLHVGRGGFASSNRTLADRYTRAGVESWFTFPGGNSPANAYVGALGGSAAVVGSSAGGYGGVNTPPAIQAGVSLVGSVSSASGGTSVTLPLNAGSKALPGGSSGLVVVVLPNASGTLSVSDSVNGAWSFLGAALNTGVFMYAFALPGGSKGLGARNTISITNSIGGAIQASAWTLPWVPSQDAGPQSNTGTSTGPNVTTGVTSQPNDLYLAIFSDAGANTNSTPANWTHSGAVAGSSGLFTDVFALQSSAIGAQTATAGYAGSQVWAGLGLTFTVKQTFHGGRGGTGNGPSGGGGGGGAGNSHYGQPGGNSQPYTASSGHWAIGGTGGAGGTGSTPGGSGGIGASNPGFPGVGIQPAGGGGGGFQSAPLSTAVNPSNTLPGTAGSNYLGADGADGMVQLTYSVGAGLPVNGGNTTFGSAATTGTIVTANGGLSVASNAAGGAAGGTGSANTIHADGGTGGLNRVGALGLGSFMSSATSPGTGSLLTTLGTMTYNASSQTSSTSGRSVAGGVAVAAVMSTAAVGDLEVTDSAGNIYTYEGSQAGGAGGNGVTVYVFVANLEFPITTSTTLTVTSATSQQYGVLWYGSPWLWNGASSANTGKGNGTGTSFSAQAGTTDNNSLVAELSLVLADTSRTVSSYANTKTLFNASQTSSLTAGTMVLSAAVTQTQAGGTGSSNGDTISGTLSGSGNWAQIVLQLTLANQQAQAFPVDWRTGTTPGAQTTWAVENSVAATGVLVVMGQCGSGASITSGPTAIADAAGNTYTVNRVTVLPSGGGTAWVATAPVTAALAAGATGTVNWGSASGSPFYSTTTLWVPNAVALEATGTSTGTASGVSGTYTPANTNIVVLDQIAAFGSPVPSFNNGTAPTNSLIAISQNYLNNIAYGQQANDKGTVTFSQTVTGAIGWAQIAIGLTMQNTGYGGGAAGGPGGTGYQCANWQYGGPGHAGAGKGGTGSGTVNTPGGGGALPGGGGGGAYSNNTAGTAGGRGGQGAVRLTWTPPLRTFNTLIVHSLGADSDPSVNPCVAIPTTDVPNNQEYPVPSVDGLLNATFSSTYSVILVASHWNSATSSTPRQLTVTVNQYEYPGGPKYSTQVSRAMTPANDSVNGLVGLGEVTLPIKDYLAYNDQSYFMVSINDSDQNDRFMDIIFLDTLGQSVIINIDPGQPGYGQYVNFFVDEATTDRDLGFVGASMQERQHQVSVLDYAQISGGAIYVASGDNLFFVYSTAGAPNLGIQYAPRWYYDRMV